MGVFSAKNGKAYANGVEIADVRTWTVTVKADNKSYASSMTGGWTRRILGRMDASGKITCYFNSDLKPRFKQGDRITLLKLCLDSGSLYGQGPAVIDDVEVECNIEGGDPVAITYSWSADGEWTLPAA